MAAFIELDWTQFDVRALVESHGLVNFDKSALSSCVAWLFEHDYEVHRLECGLGFDVLLDQWNKLFRWEEQFGYALSSDRCGLDAVRDGFEVLSSNGRSVLILDDSEVLWSERPSWLLGVLAIAQEYSLCELALGRRFICIISLPAGSNLVGQVIEQLVVPHPCVRL